MPTTMTTHGSDQLEAKPPPSAPTSSAVPHSSSVVAIALVALLSPLSTLLWSLLLAGDDPHDDEYDDLDYYRYYDDPSYYHHHSYLATATMNCNVESSNSNSTSSLANAQELAGQKDGVMSAWENIKVTVYLSAAVGFLCLLGFELFRRDPIVGKYVYDRKRLTQPGRTPPPLMLSRSLWRGCDDKEEEEGGGAGEGNGAAKGSKKKKKKRRWATSCCRVRPAILEIIFLNLDPYYVSYARAADEAQKERERRGYYACCRTGCFHNNCCNTHVDKRKRRCIEEDAEGYEGYREMTLDEDGYAFYPGYCDDYNHVYRGATTMAGSLPPAPTVSNVDPLDIVGVQSEPKWHKNHEDLFPEDDQRGTLTHADRLTGSSRIFHTSRGEVAGIRSTVTSASGDGVAVARNVGEWSVGPSAPGLVECGSVGGDVNATCEDEGQSEKESEAEPSKSSSVEGDSMSGNCKQREGDAKTSGVSHTEGNESKGELLHSTTETSGESTKLGSAKGDQSRGVNEPGKSVSKEPFHPDDFNVKVDLTSPLLAEWLRHDTAGVTEEGAKGDGEEEAAAAGSTSDPDSKPLKYPYRLLYIFLPPGFHSWTNVPRYIGHFFYLQECFRLFRRIPTPPLHLPGSRANDDGPNGVRRRTTWAVPIKRPGIDLTEGEKEFLRCAGLDTYMLVRLARFGFDVTFYPFCFAVVAILPVYKSCWTGVNLSAFGHLSLMIKVVPDKDKRMIVIVLFTAMLYLYIMRRLWFEWENFIQLRHSFLANGDNSFHTSPTYLRTYRNTCMVECVPKTHRSDQNLRDVFESLFPGQIEHAEMLIDTSKLEEILRERRKLIRKYDSLSARYLYKCWRYNAWQRDGKLVGICNRRVAEPIEPKVRAGGLLSMKKEDAFSFYNKKIKEIDELADKEYVNIVETRKKWHLTSLISPAPAAEGEDYRPPDSTAHNLYTLFVPSHIRQLLGEESQFFYGTGMVEFKSIAAKQSAVQCNLSGQPYWMITSDAPDPRDLFWSNVGASRYTLETRKILVNSVLLLGVLFWSVLIWGIRDVAAEIAVKMFEGGAETEFYTFVMTYIPNSVVALVLLWIPNLFFLLARSVIRFKSHSQCDEYVLLWNTGYRLANVFVTVFGMSFIDAINCVKNQPEEFVKLLADTVVKQSYILMNLVIMATGQETMLQLLQWRSLIKQAVVRPLINLNTRNRQEIDSLNTAPKFERSFIFGFFAPVLAYGLIIAIIYSFMCPLMLGICAMFFWVAAKVHTHNALFVYCQQCEGGGKIFYYWNRIVFITLYSSIVLFSAILILKGYREMGISFSVIMLLFTWCVDKSMTNTFVVNSLHLPISHARIHDEEESELLSEREFESDGREKFMYRHPLLFQENWNN